VADHVDLQARRSCRRRGGRTDDDDVRPEEESREQRDRQPDAEEDDERVARPLAAAERKPLAVPSQPAQQEEAAHDGEADPAPDHHPPPEVRDRVLGVALRIERILVTAAPRERDRRRRERDRSPEIAGRVRGAAIPRAVCGKQRGRDRRVA
jgi:hypothetical protein